MSANSIGSIYGLMQRAKSLKSNALDYFRYLTRSPPLRSISDKVTKSYFDMYAALIDEVWRVFQSDEGVESLPDLSAESSSARDDLINLVAATNQIIGFLEGKQVDVSGATPKTFPYDEKELDILPVSTKLLFLEAIGEYDYDHSYACSCICGLALQSLVQEGCRKHNLPYDGLAKGIGALKEAKIIKEDLHKTLLDLEKYYRDKISAHLTSEVATDEKARLFLSSLLSSGKAIFG
jgi:hypothetical protein